MGCVHCPTHDEHMEPHALIVIGPLVVGLMECPIEGCDYRFPFKILGVEVEG